MSTMELVQMIDKLPLDQKKEVENYVAGLLKNNKKDEPVVSEKRPKMRFGDLKGFITYISDDFDEPMEEFKDYM